MDTQITSKTIIRKAHNKENPYVMICRNAIHDNRLSFKAKGLLCYLLSLKDDWHIHINELTNHATDGRDSITSAINELILLGYVKRIQERKEGGKFGDVELLVYEDPSLNTELLPEPGFPVPEKPYTEKPYTENPTLVNNNKINNENINKQKNNTPIPPAGDFLDLNFLNELFERFWEIYPNKKGKEKAKLSFIRQTKNKTLEEVELFMKEMIEGLCKHVLEAKHHDDIQSLHPDWKVFYPAWPHGNTWINQKRWLDTYELDRSKIYDRIKKQNVTSGTQDIQQIIRNARTTF